MILVNESFTGSRPNIISPNEMQMIDQKIDDGKPLTGSVFAVSGEMRTQDGLASTFSKPANFEWDQAYPNDNDAAYANLVIRSGF